jgi:hypothetical protein
MISPEEHTNSFNRLAEMEDMRKGSSNSLSQDAENSIDGPAHSTLFLTLSKAELKALYLVHPDESNTSNVHLQHIERPPHSALEPNMTELRDMMRGVKALLSAISPSVAASSSHQQPSTSASCIPSAYGSEKMVAVEVSVLLESMRALLGFLWTFYHPHADTGLCMNGTKVRTTVLRATRYVLLAGDHTSTAAWHRIECFQRAELDVLVTRSWERGRRGSESRAQGPIVKGEKRTHELQSLQAL